MQLEDYFSYLGPLDIRVKGSRIGINIILWDYLDHDSRPEQIVQHYPTLTLEQVYATLTYYWRYKEQMDAYLKAIDQLMEDQRREQDRNPSPAIQRLRALAQERATATAASES